MSADIGGAVAFGLLALLLLFIAKRRGFFHFSPAEWKTPIRLLHVLGAFAIYFFVSYVIAHLVVALFKKQIMLNYMGSLNWLNFLLSLCIFIFLALYLKSLPKTLSRNIFRREGERGPLIEDVWAGLTAWIVAFPLVLFLSQVLEALVTKIFNLTTLPEQIAVKYLKATFHESLYFTMAVISIVILAPLIEETLFRGFLQSYIRQHLGSKQAIVITSFCFSLFHFSFDQGVGNISIILSLFVLALFLGFLYEKRGSLLAPITLHATFNIISVINLYFFEDITK
jgi:membrane protease YdiL (CAAX protease family)